MLRRIALVILLGSLALAARANFNSFQVYHPSGTLETIHCNLVTGVASIASPCTLGATCNGDKQTATRTVSISSGTPNLSATVDTFAVGDVGKTIFVPGAGGGGGTLSTTIKAFSDAQNIVLAINAGTTLSASSKLLVWGTDDSPAFAAFKTWALANQDIPNHIVELTIPSGSNCWLGTSVASQWTYGIYNLLVLAGGATLNGDNGIGVRFGGGGQCTAGLTAVNGCSARIQTVSAGSSTVQLTAASLSAGYISRFTVGNYLLVTGLDVQGLFISAFGYPTNPFFFEYKKITAIDAGTGTITLDSALDEGYSADWPNFNSGNNFEADAGGPATIYAFPSNWDVKQEFRGATGSPFVIQNSANQTYSSARHIIYRDVQWVGAHGGIPTQNLIFEAINNDYTGVNIEFDKLIDTVIFNNTDVNIITIQSGGSLKTFEYRNSTVSQLTGTPRYFVGENLVIGSFRVGALAYGRTDSAECTNCVVNTLFGTASIVQTDFLSCYSNASGVIQFAFSCQGGSGPAGRWFVPGTNAFYSGGTFYAAALAVINLGAVTADVWPAPDNQTTSTAVTISSGSPNLGTADAIFVSGDVGKTILVNGAGSGGGQLRTWIVTFTDANNVVLGTNASTALSSSTQTVQWGTANVYGANNWPSGQPPMPGTDPRRYTVHPAPQWTCNNCTGVAAFAMVSVEAGATPGAPLFEYASYTYQPTTAGALTAPQSWGWVDEWVFDVTTAYSGAGNARLTTGQFFTVLTYADGSEAFYQATINLKQVGRRVITPAGVTCDGSPGACSGDTVGAIGDAWVPNQLALYMQDTLGVGTTPVVEITVRTTQGVVLPYLLKRDLDPAANDNTPAFLNQAA